MATATPSAPGASGPKPSAKFVEYDQFIEQQLDKTRGQVRLVDIASGLLLLLTGTLVYFLVVALIDHWVMRTGLGFWGRLFFFAVYLIGALAFVAREIVPLLVRRINPVYAAATIEQSKPTLKNSLVNLLLFRSGTRAVPAALLEAMEEQAATSLAHLPGESAVDQSRLIKIGYIGLAALALCAIYKVASPKDPFATVRRVIMPWADISAPSRVSILDVQPGNVRAFRGEPVVVSAEVRGLRGAPVTLYYSTADGQAVDQAVTMNLPASDFRYTASIPAGPDGLQQRLTYRIEADDARTRTYNVDVQAAPTIVVESIGYHYPAYTKLLDKSVENQGDIRGIEGTEITIQAQANHDIRDAHIDFNCDGRDDLAMTVDGMHATASFKLTLEKDRKSPQYASYQLRFTNPDGFANKQPTQYAIEVTPDLLPEVQIVLPKAERVQLPVNGAATIQIQASDLDFALRRVNLSATAAKKPLFSKLLLDEEHAGQFIGKHQLDARKLRLKTGDVVEYWVAVEDNKSPGANKVETAHQFITIVDPAKQGAKGNEPNAQDNEDDQAETKSDQEKPDKSDKGQGNPDQAQPQQKKQNPDDPQNGAQPPDDEHPMGDANAKAKPNEQVGDPDDVKKPMDKPRQRGNNEDANPNEQPQPNDANPQPGENGNADEQPLGDPKAQQKPGEKGQDGAGGDPQAGEQKPGDQKGADQGAPNQPNNAENQGGGDQQQGGGDQKPGKAGPQQDANAGAKNNANQKPDQKGNDKGGDRQQQKPGQQGDAQRNQPVAKDGADDGNAIEKILQHRQQQDAKQPDADKAKPQGGDNRQKPNDLPNKKPAGQGNPNEVPNQERQPGNKNPGREQQDNKNGAGPNERAKPGDNKPSEQQQQGPGENPAADGNQASKGADNQTPPAAGKANGEKENTPDAQGEPDGDKQPGAKQPNQPGQKQPAGQGDPKQDNAQQGGKQPGQRQPAEPGNKQGEKQQPGDKSQKQPNAEKQPGQPQGAQQPDAADQPKPGQQNNPNEGVKAKPPEGYQEKPANQKAQQKSDAQKPKGQPQPADQAQPAEQQNPKQQQEKQGQGAQSKPQNDNKQQSPQEKRPGQPKPSPDQQKGESGAAKQSHNDKGSPLPQDSNQQRPKSGQGENQKQDQGNQEEPQSPSNSKKQSDSKGGDDGDRSGGGGKGGGQKGKAAGTGDSGQNTEAEQGSGKGGQRGSGETSGRAGADQQSNSKTGQPGDQKGSGSGPQAGQNTDQGGDQTGNSAEQQGQDAGNSGKNGASPNGGGNGSPAGGRPNNNSTSMQKGETAPGGADDPNLDYARKATDLAIEHLRDQMKNDHPDQELLDKLGWSKDDLKNFLSRWEKLRQDAKQVGEEGEQAQRELDETLRSLGVRPRSADVRSNDARNDESRGLKEGRRTAPPAEYAEQLKAYTRGTAKGRAN